MRNRIRYSQNFIKDINLIIKLIKMSSIEKDDIVLDIGAGDGIITSVLASHAKSVIAYEIDKDLYSKLVGKFGQSPKIHLKNVDFLDTTLPDLPYKVFSNIPFNMTSEILKKLLFSDDPPVDSYIILQKESAMKFLGKPIDIKNSLLSILIYPWFEGKIIYEFNPNDFFPKPNVEIVLINIRKRKIYLVENSNKEKYFDFVAYTYSQYRPKLPNNATQSELDSDEWIKLFNEYGKTQTEKSRDIKGSYSKLIQQQNKLEKIHRTRVDTTWKKFNKS